MQPDDSIVFKIDNQQVSFDNNGDPRIGGELTASRTEVIENVTSGDPLGFSYCCFKDVTALVREYSDKAPDPATNYPGQATYTVGDITDGTLGNDSEPGTNGTQYQLAHAGWSLIIIYSGPTTLGHQLYLFDRFTYADDYSDLDFDSDGNPGGDITRAHLP